MLNSRIYTILVILMMFFPAAIGLQGDTKNNVLDNKYDTYTSHNSQNDTIQGQSYLNITGQISPNSQLNATWQSNITIAESYGSDLLPNQSHGLRKQIDQSMGNGDNFLSDSEIFNFVQIINSSRSWNNAELGSCCAFDYLPFNSQMGNQIIVFPPMPGDVNVMNGSWGWSESADIYGFTDNRVIRILDLPRLGALIEEIPLNISLPGDWEFRYSAMSSIVSGTPTIFTVNRSEAPVSSNIRITIAENIPPIISASKSPTTSSTISLTNPYTYSAVCNDGILESPLMEWSIIKNSISLSSINNSWFEFMPLEYGFSHGEVARIALKCTDSHGANSSWFEDVLIDGISPEWSGTLSTCLDSCIQLDTLQTSHSVVSGSQINLNITATDESNLPVSIELFSNMSDGWRQHEVNQGIFSFSVYQGDNINGLHLNITDRHLSKEIRSIELILVILDEAGNLVTKEWNLEINDGNPPVILMDIMANNSLVRLDNPAREGDQIILVFSNSYDDLDSISNTKWHISIDGVTILETSSWSYEVEKLNLPKLAVGIHEVSIIAHDSKGNQRIENYPLTIFPNRGVDLEVISHSIALDSLQTGNALFVLEMRNNFNDDTFARACIESKCSRFVNFPGADAETSTIAFLEFEFEMPPNSPVNITIEWDSNSAGENGNFILQQVIDSKENKSNIGIKLIVIIISILSIFLIYQSKITIIKK